MTRPAATVLNFFLFFFPKIFMSLQKQLPSARRPVSTILLGADAIASIGRMPKSIAKIRSGNFFISDFVIG
jgi:hypothetical protein